MNQRATWGFVPDTMVRAAAPARRKYRKAPTGQPLLPRPGSAMELILFALADQGAYEHDVIGTADDVARWAGTSVEASAVRKVLIRLDQAGWLERHKSTKGRGQGSVTTFRLLWSPYGNGTGGRE